MNPKFLTNLYRIQNDRKSATVLPLSSVAPQERLLPLNKCFSVHVCLLHC